MESVLWAPGAGLEADHALCQRGLRAQSRRRGPSRRGYPDLRARSDLLDDGAPAWHRARQPDGALYRPAVETGTLPQGLQAAWAPRTDGCSGLARVVGASWAHWADGAERSAGAGWALRPPRDPGRVGKPGGGRRPGCAGPCRTARADWADRRGHGDGRAA